MEEVKTRTHESRHGFRCDLGDLRHRKAHKKRAEKSAKNIANVVKLAQLAGMSYGEYMAGRRKP